MPTRPTGPICVSDAKTPRIDQGTNALVRMLAPGVIRQTGPRPGSGAASMYFAIYYDDKDGSFRRAAETWAKGIPANCPVELLSVRTLIDFRTKWNSLPVIARALSKKIQRGALFLHGSLPQAESLNNRGLEFRPTRALLLEAYPELATVIPSDLGRAATAGWTVVSRLRKLQWAPGAQLEIHACMSGYGPTPIAKVFAESQAVDTAGEDGMAIFSASKDHYVQISSRSSDVYLLAFARKQNTAIKLLEGKLVAWNKPMPPVRFSGGFRPGLCDHYAQDISLDI